MGVPAFYRWLSEKYPLVVVDAIEEEAAVVNGVTIPVNTCEPNPNGIEYDNLYLDMNGIIHPCFHPEDRISPTTLDEVFRSIFEYIDRLFAVVRPRKLLYMAIDGVAPRAKMNQQRSRRFRTAKDAAEAAVEEEKLREEFEREGRKLPPRVESQLMDSNVITPGTEFMSVLAIALRYYIHRRMNKDAGWKNVKVILSDSNVPGEGEHKIMSYVRLQRSLSGYDPNTRHCLYGLDADLIMLALATHEVHFSILREIVFTPGQDKCFLCGRVGHVASECQGNSANQTGNFDKKDSSDVSKKPYQFLNIWTLREYLELEMRIPDLPFEIDLEHVVDDFVLMCFFAGNDFLPHMPTLDIREGAIDLLISVYKKELRAMGGYLSDGCKLDLTRLQCFIKAVGSNEEKIFQKRAYLHKKRAERIKREKLEALKKDCAETTDEAECFITDARVGEQNLGSGEEENWKQMKSKLKESLRQRADVFNLDNPEVDKVRLGEPGWKERYYEQKFGANSADEREALRKDLVLKYAEGLCWIMNYYYEGVCSWQWFYPYHYASFASDLKDIARLKIKFELGAPFKPFNQLLGVFPASSAHALPEHYRKLMMDPKSPIIEFYPNDFEVDMDGKRYSWQGVAKLPFIDEKGLLAEVAKIDHTHTKEEARRNSVMHDMLFVSDSHELSPYILALADRCKHMTDAPVLVKERIDPTTSDGMNGYISLLDGDPRPSVFRSPIQGMHDIFDNHVISAVYHLPDPHHHVTRPLEGINFPDKTVCEDDFESETVLWHEDFGRRPSHGSDRATRAISRLHLGQSARRLILSGIQTWEVRNSEGVQIDPPHRPYRISNMPSFVQDSSGYSPPGYPRSTTYRPPYSPPHVSGRYVGYPSQFEHTRGRSAQLPRSPQFAYNERRPPSPRAHMHPRPDQGLHPPYSATELSYHDQYNRGVRLAAPPDGGRGFNHPWSSGHSRASTQSLAAPDGGRGFTKPRSFGPSRSPGQSFAAPEDGRAFSHTRLVGTSPSYAQILASPDGGRGFNHPHSVGTGHSNAQILASPDCGRGFGDPWSRGTYRSTAQGRGAARRVSQLDQGR